MERPITYKDCLLIEPVELADNLKQKGRTYIASALLRPIYSLSKVWILRARTEYPYPSYSLAIPEIGRIPGVNC
jgi:hypothetical protein